MERIPIERLDVSKNKIQDKIIKEQDKIIKSSLLVLVIEIFTANS